MTVLLHRIYCVALLATILIWPVAAFTVDLGYSKYKGVAFQDVVLNQTNVNFLGVRYAAPPTASLRFQAAHLPAYTPGTQTANTQPTACFAAAQGNSAVTPFRRSSAVDTAASVPNGEDCLFMNIFVPGGVSPNGKAVPVIVWLHAGGYAAGAASQLPGNDILREAGGGVILVIPQYRLGLFGFLAGQKVHNDGLLNAGLLDQQFALRWVQDHIYKFGGDPTKVTIWGQSAGAGSVLQHVIAERGKTNPPLFRAAMTSSTFLPSQYNFNDRIPELLYNEVVSQTNCTGAPNTLACLRSVAANTLQEANVQISNSGFFGTFSFVPVVDGTFIMERPLELLRKNVVNTRSLLSVTNTFEGVSFVNQSTANTVQPLDYISQLFPQLDASQVSAAAGQYAGLGTNLFQVNAIMGETIFICPTYALMRGVGEQAFKGEFAIPPGTHASDVGYYFPSLNPGGPAFANPDFDRAFPESFLNFALSLDPNIKWDPADVTPLWKPWNGINEMLFNKTEENTPDIRLITTSDALLQRCEFWESVGAQIGQ